MAQFSVRGLSAATAGTAEHCVADLWYPTGRTVRVRVFEVWVFKTGTTGVRHKLVRTTARGTVGSTVTPDADNAWDTQDVPNSGVLLDLAAFSVQPTFASPMNMGLHMNPATGSEGSGWVWILAKGLVIPPNSGLAIVQDTAAITPISEVTYIWGEGEAD